MWFRPLLASLTFRGSRIPARRREPKPTRRRAAYRPQLEVLEDRRLLSLTVAGDFAPGDSPADIVVADLNRDGRPDLAAVDYAGRNASVLLDDDDITFELVYDEVLRYYVLIFPAMSKRLPLDDPSVWRSPATASYVLKMTDVSLWAYYHYMPRTRELSRYRRDLLQRFCRKVLREAGQGLTTTAESAHASH